MKKIFIALALLLATTNSSVAQGIGRSGSYLPREGEIEFTILQSTKDRTIHKVLNTPFTHHKYSRFKPIDIDTAKPSHNFDGIGVSMTDASCWLLSQMDIESRHKFLKKVFTKRELNMSMIRLNCGASDYATELYNYNDHKDDVEMKHFSVARDEVYMIPIIKQIYDYCPDVFVFSSIWSVPGWMKSSGEMCGGALLDKYMPAFANYWSAYVKAYAERGIKIDAVTVQNEPFTDQEGGCPATLVSTKQEIELAGKLMPEAFKRAGLDTKIWIHDHNYNDFERVNKMLAEKDVKRNIDAVAWHPYSGTPEMIQKVRELHPDTKMHLTERGPNLTKKAVQNEKWWSDVIFGALNNGCSSYSSWNLLLDPDGKPNVGRHPCGGLYTYDYEKGKLTESVQVRVLQHFSPYVKRGAKILSIDQPDDNMTAIAFQNPEGDYVICVTAAEKPNKRQSLQIKYKGQYMFVSLPLDTWSMTTILLEK